MWTEFFSFEDYVAIKPEIILSLFAVGILITDLMLEKKDKYLLVRPSIILFSYIIKGKLKNFDTKETGNDTYPPIPNIKSGFSFFKIIIDFIIE